MSSWTRKVPIICRRCGHGSEWHMQSRCTLTVGTGERPVCDCDGWERDPFPETRYSSDGTNGPCTAHVDGPGGPLDCMLLHGHEGRHLDSDGASFWRDRP